MSSEALARSAAEEAIQSLGYLKPSAVDTVIRLATASPELHPRAVTTAFRRQGDQLSPAEKKVLGIRANAFLSRQALDEMTDKGRAAPLDSHLLTVLRAGFTIGRAATLARIASPTPNGSYFVAEYAGFLGHRCTACSRLDGARVDPKTVSIFPPEGCEVEGCAINFRIRLRSPLMNYDD